MSATIGRTASRIVPSVHTGASLPVRSRRRRAHQAKAICTMSAASIASAAQPNGATSFGNGMVSPRLLRNATLKIPIDWRGPGSAAITPKYQNSTKNRSGMLRTAST